MYKLFMCMYLFSKKLVYFTCMCSEGVANLLHGGHAVAAAGLAHLPEQHLDQILIKLVGGYVQRALLQERAHALDCKG